MFRMSEIWPSHWLSGILLARYFLQKIKSKKVTNKKLMKIMSFIISSGNKSNSAFFSFLKEFETSLEIDF